MKYADSFSHREIISATGTTYSEWFPVGFANELYMYTDSTMDVAGTLSIVTTVERFVPYRTPAHATIATFTAITAAATEEEHCTSIGAGTDKIGTRVRFKYVSTYTDGTVSIYSTIFAKRN